jgi:hypothetical protein
MTKDIFFLLLLLFNTSMYSDNSIMEKSILENNDLTDADNLNTTINENYPINYGRMDDTIYINPYFGFKFSVLSSWTIKNKKQIDFVLSKGKEVVTFKDELVNSTVDKMDLSSNTLLMISRYKTGAFNPSLIIMAEEISMFSTTKTGKDYLLQVKRQLSNSNLNMIVNEPKDGLTLSDIKFDKLDCFSEINKTHLSYYCSIQKNHALVFIITYIENEDHVALLNMIKSTQFNTK